MSTQILRSGLKIFYNKIFESIYINYVVRKFKKLNGYLFSFLITYILGILLERYFENNNRV